MDNNVGSPDRTITTETPSPPTMSRLGMARPPFGIRKLSFPASLHPHLLGLTANGDNGKDFSHARRRFSNVGDVVSRKLSSTIGWRTSTVPPQEVITQGRMLCGQYIKYRLKRSGIFNRKLCLYRLRGVIGNASGETVREVSPFLLAAGIELERMYPKLYTSVARQINMTPGGVMVSDKTAATLLAATSHQLLKSDITWGKVVAVFAVAGGLAVDCVCQGHPEYVYGLMQGMTEVLEDDLAEWVATHGGWVALCAQCIRPQAAVTLTEYFSNILLIIVIFSFIALFARCIAKLGYI